MWKPGTRQKCQVCFVDPSLLHRSHSHIVIRPSLQKHLPDFGQGSNVQLSAGNDIEMDDTTIPLAPFEEAEGDDSYVEAVKQAAADHRYVLNVIEFSV